MKNGYRVTREIVKANPLLLSTIQDKKLLEYAESLWPYETGIEIECSLIGFKKAFKIISGILDVNIDSTEQRFRIPKGIQGMKVLYSLCQVLKQQSALNKDSGIHYHIDFRDCFNRINENFIQRHESWMLNELKSWKYTGTFNTWKCTYDKTAVKYHQSYQTIEFRIGEMSFDYEVIIKRILHAQQICRRLKNALKQ